MRTETALGRSQGRLLLLLLQAEGFAPRKSGWYPEAGTTIPVLSAMGWAHQGVSGGGPVLCALQGREARSREETPFRRTEAVHVHTEAGRVDRCVHVTEGVCPRPHVCLGARGRGRVCPAA